LTAGRFFAALPGFPCSKSDENELFYLAVTKRKSLRTAKKKIRKVPQEFSVSGVILCERGWLCVLRKMVVCEKPQQQPGWMTDDAREPER
jgi:hypothetical protein